MKKRPTNTQDIFVRNTIIEHFERLYVHEERTFYVLDSNVAL